MGSFYMGSTSTGESSIQPAGQMRPPEAIFTHTHRIACLSFNQQQHKQQAAAMLTEVRLNTLTMICHAIQQGEQGDTAVATRQMENMQVHMEREGRSKTETALLKNNHTHTHTQYE